MKILRQIQICSTRWRSTAASSVATGSPADIDATNDMIVAKSYNEVPGPRPWPIIGNTWRMLPIIGILKLKKCIYKNEPELIFLILFLRTISDIGFSKRFLRFVQTVRKNSQVGRSCWSTRFIICL